MSFIKQLWGERMDRKFADNIEWGMVIRSGKQGSLDEIAELEAKIKEMK